MSAHNPSRFIQWIKQAQDKESFSAVACVAITPSFSFDVFRVRSNHAFDDPPTNELVLATHTDGPTTSLTTDFGFGRRTAVSRIGSTSVCPPDQWAHFDGHLSASVETCGIAFPWQSFRDRVEQLVDREVRDFGELHSGFHELPWTIPLHQEILHRCSQPVDQVNGLIIEQLINRMIFGLVRQAGTSFCVPDQKASLSIDRTLHVLSYIEAQLHTTITVEQVSSLVDVSPFYFCRLFKQTMGMSLIQFVKQLRLEKAKQLLSRSSDPISMIAIECGYFDQSHLNRDFKSATGLTPGRFRRDHRTTL
ncbi:MAG: AraC family transcriptional regulator [Planctomycetota bacterium]